MSLTPEEQHQLAADVKTCMNDLSEIKSVIIGNEQFQQRGMAGDVADLKAWKTSVNDKILYVTGAIAASWFFVGLIGYVAYEWVKTKLAGAGN
jgi:hypothetical protein